jgi:malate permease and related proteins
LAEAAAIAIVVGLLGITINGVAPVFIIAFVGYVARRTLKLDPQPIARLALYVFVPALVLNSLLTTQMGGDEIARIGVFVVALTLILIGVSAVAARLMRLPRSEATGLALSVSFINAANYGIPVSLFAFGQEGFDRAVMFATFESILLFTLALFVAARGQLGWREALGPMIRVPVVWVALVAIGLRLVDVELPTVMQRAVSVVSAGAVPIVILLLGIQVAGLSMRQLRLMVGAACVGRLIVSPAIGLLLVALIQPAPLTARVLVLEAAMPTAVNVTLLASEFDAEPDLVSSVALLTTAISVVTVTGWVAYLQSL